MAWTVRGRLPCLELGSTTRVSGFCVFWQYTRTRVERCSVECSCCECDLAKRMFGFLSSSLAARLGESLGCSNSCLPYYLVADRIRCRISPNIIKRLRSSRAGWMNARRAGARLGSASKSPRHLAVAVATLAIYAYAWFLMYVPIVRATQGAVDESDTWAVIVNTSKFFLNYRHTVNTMALYHVLRRLGLPDSRIILMQADCATCDPRMVRPGGIYTSPGSTLEEQLGKWPGTDELPPEVDYRDKDVSAESLIRVLTGNTHYGTARGQIMASTNTSNVLVFLSGHGGDGFLKFHDQTELTSADMGAAVEYMYLAGRYKNLFIVLDTCQASTMWEDIAEGVDGWAATGSSARGFSGYALNHDGGVGTFLMDEFSHWMWAWLENYYGPSESKGSQTIDDLLKYVMRQRMSSVVQYDASRARHDGLLIETFFGGGSPRAVSTGWSPAERASWDLQLA